MEFYEGLGEAMEHLAHRGAFLTVKNDAGRVNTMTIAWGYIGFSWRRPYFVAMVRPQRYTHKMLETADSFTVSIPFGEGMEKALGICGTKSGYEVDNKAELAGIGFVPGKSVASPVVSGCDMYYECSIGYIDTIHVDKLPEDISRFYQGDTSDLYYGEIVEAYRK